MTFSAVILAGGNSSRMGYDKAFLEIGGKTLLARQIETACAAGASEVLISGRPGMDYSAFAGRAIADRFSDAGPLAGIEAALTEATHPCVLVLAVDLPAMNVDFLQRLRGSGGGNFGAVARANGNLEPLAAFYLKAARAIAKKLLHQKTGAVKDFAGECVAAGLAAVVDFPAGASAWFKNCNSPADLAGLA